MIGAVRWLLALLLLVGSAHALELLDRCDRKFKKCTFDCVQEFPLDETKRKGCETRCQLDRALCKTREGVEKLGESVRDFLEGFSRER